MKSRVHLSVLICTVLLALGSAEAAAKFRIRGATVNGTSYLFLTDIATYYGMTYRAGRKKATLSSRYSTLRFTVDKRASTINDVTVHLSFAPTLRKNDVILSETDFRLVLDPILRVKSLPRTAVRRIMIDPGHGGRDRGAIGKLYKEKDIVLQTAKLLARALRQRGYEVNLTRSGDTELTLGRRGELAKKWRSDAFISLHANYVDSKGVNGAETFLLAPKGTASTYGKSVTGTARSGNKFDKTNARLAYEIQKHLLTSTECEDRGVKHAKFLVLRNAPCASVLVELGFLSNASEERRLGSASHQARIVTGLVNGIVAYHRSLADKK